MSEQNLAWVPGRGDAPPEPRDRPVVRMLAALSTAAEAAAGGRASEARLYQGLAKSILAEDALTAIQAMQQSGQLPPAGTEGWERLLDLARRGEVEITFAVVVRDDSPPPPRMPAPPPPEVVQPWDAVPEQRPVLSRDEMREWFG